MNCYTVRQIAELLSMSYGGVRNLIKAGRIKTFDISHGGKERILRVTEEALMNFIAESSGDLLRKRKLGEKK